MSWIPSSLLLLGLIIVCQMISTLVLLVIEYIFTIKARLSCDIIAKSSDSGPMVFSLYKFF